MGGGGNRGRSGTDFFCRKQIPNGRIFNPPVQIYPREQQHCCSPPLTAVVLALAARARLATATAEFRKVKDDENLYIVVIHLLLWGFNCDAATQPRAPLVVAGYVLLSVSSTCDRRALFLFSHGRVHQVPPLARVDYQGLSGFEVHTRYIQQFEQILGTRLHSMLDRENTLDTRTAVHTRRFSTVLASSFCR